MKTNTVIKYTLFTALLYGTAGFAQNTMTLCGFMDFNGSYNNEKQHFAFGLG